MAYAITFAAFDASRLTELDVENVLIRFRIPIKQMGRALRIDLDSAMKHYHITPEMLGFTLRQRHVAMVIQPLFFLSITVLVELRQLRFRELVTLPSLAINGAVLLMLAALSWYKLRRSRKFPGVDQFFSEDSIRMLGAPMNVQYEKGELEPFETEPPASLLPNVENWVPLFGVASRYQPHYPIMPLSGS